MTELLGQLQAMAAFDGVDGCALVETETGMVWHFAGSLPEIERVAEAAIEFWRVQLRLRSYLADVGPLKFVAYSFANREVVLYPCSEKQDLVLVCVLAKQTLDWKTWGAQLNALRRHVSARR